MERALGCYAQGVFLALCTGITLWQGSENYWKCWAVYRKCLLSNPLPICLMGVIVLLCCSGNPKDFMEVLENRDRCVNNC